MEAVNGCVSLNIAISSLGMTVSIFAETVLSGYFYYVYSIELSFQKYGVHILHIQYHLDFQVSLKGLMCKSGQ
jgi:hypothetical protein